MSYSSDNSYEKILNRVLGNEILSNVDKRVGSIIYDAIAPMCMELAEAYVKMDILENQTFLLTATGNNLDKRVYDYGITRTPASYSQRIVEFKKYKTNTNGDFVLDEHNEKILVDMEIPVGSRFTIPTDNSLIFKYIGKINDEKIVECETLGTIGNEHLGQLLPLNPIKDLIQANIISTYKPGEDMEDDESLRTRAVNALNYDSFGGNISDYIRRVNAIDGVGNTKVFPSWQYNGSVLLSVVDPQYNPITEEFIRNLKEQIDPDDVINEFGTVIKSNTSGQGIGIAPIGHYVTVTTPVVKNVDVSLTVELREGYTLETIYEDVLDIIENYFENRRKTYSQNTDITIYVSDIIVAVKQLDGILDCYDVRLIYENVIYNERLKFVDEGHIGMQYLPNLGELTIE